MIKLVNDADDADNNTNDEYDSNAALGTFQHTHFLEYNRLFADAIGKYKYKSSNIMNILRIFLIMIFISRDQPFTALLLSLSPPTASLFCDRLHNS